MLPGLRAPLPAQEKETLDPAMAAPGEALCVGAYNSPTTRVVLEQHLMGVRRC